MSDKGSQIIIFTTADEKISVDVFLGEETVWLTQQQIADLFGVTRTGIVEHIGNIYGEGELVPEATCRDFRQVRMEGSREVSRSIPHYNLDMIISVGYNELQRLNLLVSQFLDFAEFQALEQTSMTMADWIAALNNQISSLNRKSLQGKGKISHNQAIEKAEKELEIYRMQEMKKLESDFDHAVKQLEKKRKRDETDEQT